MANSGTVITSKNGSDVSVSSEKGGRPSTSTVKAATQTRVQTAYVKRKKRVREYGSRDTYHGKTAEDWASGKFKRQTEA